MSAALDAVNCIVFDDIHYVFENFVNKGDLLLVFIDLLRKVLLNAEGEKKVLLISEDLLVSYIEILENKELDECLIRFDPYPDRYSIDLQNI